LPDGMYDLYSLDPTLYLLGFSVIITGLIFCCSPVYAPPDVTVNVILLLFSVSLSSTFGVFPSLRLCPSLSWRFPS